MAIERIDYSRGCNRDDEDRNNPCMYCTRFVFPIGCMYDVDEEEN